MVFIHYKFPGICGQIIWKLAQFAVPVFFMTAGFYSYGKDISTLTRRLKKIVEILVISYFLYFIYFAFFNFINGSITEFLVANCSPQSLVKLLIFSDVEFAIHLWYLVSMAETYLFFICAEKYSFYKAVERCSVLFLVLHLVVVIVVNTFGFPWFAKMNFAVWGIPYYLIGCYFARNGVSICNLKLVASTVCGAIISLIPVLLKTKVDFSEIGVVVLSTGIFMLAIKNSTASISRGVEFIGDKLSQNIYILHILIAYLLNALINKLGVLTFLQNGWLYPIIVCVVSIAVSLVIYLFTGKMHTSRTNLKE